MLSGEQQRRYEQQAEKGRGGGGGDSGHHHASPSVLPELCLREAHKRLTHKHEWSLKAFQSPCWTSLAFAHWEYVESFHTKDLKKCGSMARMIVQPGMLRNLASIYSRNQRHVNENLFGPCPFRYLTLEQALLGCIYWYVRHIFSSPTAPNIWKALPWLSLS